MKSCTRSQLPVAFKQIRACCCFWKYILNVSTGIFSSQFLLFLEVLIPSFCKRGRRDLLLNTCCFLTAHLAILKYHRGHILSFSGEGSSKLLKCSPSLWFHLQWWNVVCVCSMVRRTKKPLGDISYNEQEVGYFEFSMQFFALTRAVFEQTLML